MNISDNTGLRAALSLLRYLTSYLKIINMRGTWVTQSVKQPTSAQVMISWFVGSSPTLGSVLTAHSLEPVSDSFSLSLSLSLSLSAPPLLMPVSSKMNVLNFF